MHQRFSLLVALIMGIIVGGTPLAFAATTPQRIAVVIGNNTYANSPLDNPVNDAGDIAAALKAGGFQVTFLPNANKRQMKDAIRALNSALRKGGTGLFYFAGHGMQVNGVNYLIPVDAEIQGDSDVEDQGVDANWVLGTMQDAQNDLNILILDACRNNPFARSVRSYKQGLAQMDAAKGALIAYSTAPGQVADDGKQHERNSPYTKQLVHFLRQPGLSLEEVFKRVRQGVAKETNDRQIPWESTSVTGDFCFICNPAAVANATPGNQAPVATVAPPATPTGNSPVVSPSVTIARPTGGQQLTNLQNFMSGKAGNPQSQKSQTTLATAKVPKLQDSAPAAPQEVERIEEPNERPVKNVRRGTYEVVTEVTLFDTPRRSATAVAVVGEGVRLQVIGGTASYLRAVVQTPKGQKTGYVLREQVAAVEKPAAQPSVASASPPPPAPTQAATEKPAPEPVQTASREEERAEPQSTRSVGSGLVIEQIAAHRQIVLAANRPSQTVPIVVRVRNSSGSTLRIHNWAERAQVRLQALGSWCAPEPILVPDSNGAMEMKPFAVYDLTFGVTFTSSCAGDGYAGRPDYRVIATVDGTQAAEVTDVVVAEKEHQAQQTREAIGGLIGLGLGLGEALNNKRR